MIANEQLSKFDPKERRKQVHLAGAHSLIRLAPYDRFNVAIRQWIKSSGINCPITWPCTAEHIKSSY